MDQPIGAVRDLLMHLDGTHQLFVMTCWPPTVLYKLWRNVHEMRSKRGMLSVRFTTVDERHLPWSITNQHQALIVVDLTCPGTVRVLEAAGHMLHFRFRWIVLQSTFDAGIVRGWKACSDYRQLEQLPLLISNELFYFCRDVSTGSDVVRQQYRFNATSPSEPIIETFGTWEAGTGVCVAPRSQRPTVTSVRRQNFNRFHLRASVVIQHNETMNHLDDLKDKHIDTISRANFQLTKIMAQALNASTRFTFVDRWGYMDSASNRYSGMIGELQNGLADIGGSSMFITQDRIKVVDYIVMTTSSRTKFIFRAPKLSFTDNVFVLPFDQYVWYCTVSIIVLAGILLLVVLRTERRFDAAKDDPAELRLSDTLLNMFGTTCQQGSFIEPKMASSRCLILLCLVVLMFLYAGYSANIVALIQSPSTKIQTLEDLLNSRLKIGAENTTYNVYYFRHETERVRKALYERKIRNKDGSENFLTMAKGVELIRQGHYAFHTESGACYKLISETFQEEEKCGLQELEYLNVLDPYYAIGKNSSFRESICISFFKLREFGIRDREQLAFYTKKPRCTGASSFIPVSVIDVWPALAMMGWGYLLTFTVLVAEQLWVRVRGRIRPTNAYFLQ